MPFVNNVVWVFIAFLIGSLPTGYLVGKRVRGIDLREHGSGNVGATNVFRTIGKGWGTAVLLIDLLKGLIAVVILAPTISAFPNLTPVLKQFLFGCAAIAGHTWSPWLKLQGGKGVATSSGVLLGIFPLATTICLLIWALCFVVKRYVSLASIVAAACFPLVVLMFYRHVESFGLVLLISAGLAGLLIYNHRSNIERLRAGKELKLKFKE